MDKNTGTKHGYKKAKKTEETKNYKELQMATQKKNNQKNGRFEKADQDGCLNQTAFPLYEKKNCFLIRKKKSYATFHRLKKQKDRN